MKLFLQLGKDGVPVTVEVGAAYYYPGRGWLVRAYHEHINGYDSVEGQGTSLEAALTVLKTNWMKSWWFTGAPQPKIEAP